MGNMLLWILLSPLLTIVVAIPFSERLLKAISLAGSLIGLGLTFIFFFNYSPLGLGFSDAQINISWISYFGIHLGLAVDGLNLPFILLTKLLTPIALILCWNRTLSLKAMTVLLLFLEFSTTGVFLSSDIVVFYLFWELSLIPLFLLIGVFGKKERSFASNKFFLFNLGSSLLILIPLLGVFIGYQEQFGLFTANIASLYKIILPTHTHFLGLSLQDWVFLGFMLGFLTRTPCFPFHTWLPKTQAEAPTSVNLLLCSVLISQGVYAILRIAIPLCPHAFVHFLPVLIPLLMFGILYASLLALNQTDLNKFLSYVSITHLGFIMLGICQQTTATLVGSTLHLVNYGISMAALFILSGLLFRRSKKAQIVGLNGLKLAIPKLAFLLSLFLTSLLLIPSLNGFMGELLILSQTKQKSYTLTFCLILGLILALIYTAKIIKMCFSRTPSQDNSMKDISIKETAIILPLILLVFALGLFPNLLLKKIRPTLEDYWITKLPKMIADTQDEIDTSTDIPVHAAGKEVKK